MKIIKVPKPNTSDRPSWAGDNRKFKNLLMSKKKWKFEK